jgi:hypothetical protein
MQATVKLKYTQLKGTAEDGGRILRLQQMCG